jgi:hypothetical protein
LKSRRKITAYEEFDRNSSAAAKFLDEGNSCLPDASWIDDFQILASVESVNFQLVLGGALKIAGIGRFSLEIVDDVALPVSLVENLFAMHEKRKTNLSFFYAFRRRNCQFLAGSPADWMDIVRAKRGPKVHQIFLHSKIP